MRIHVKAGVKIPADLASNHTERLHRPNGYHDENPTNITSMFCLSKTFSGTQTATFSFFRLLFFARFHVLFSRSMRVNSFLPGMQYKKNHHTVQQGLTTFSWSTKKAHLLELPLWRGA